MNLQTLMTTKKVQSGKQNIQSEHAAKQKRYIEHFRDVVHKNRPRGKKSLMNKTLKTVGDDYRVEYDVGQVASSIESTIKQKRVKSIDRKNIVAFIQAQQARKHAQQEAAAEEQLRLA